MTMMTISITPIAALRFLLQSPQTVQSSQFPHSILLFRTGPPRCVCVCVCRSFSAFSRRGGRARDSDAMAELMEAIEAAVLAKRKKQPAFEEGE